MHRWPDDCVSSGRPARQCPLFTETPLPQYLTVGHLLRQFQEFDPNLPVRLAINPDFPFAHFVGAEVVVRDGKAYIADDGQEDYLPVGARDALTWA